MYNSYIPEHYKGERMNRLPDNDFYITAIAAKLVDQNGLEIRDLNFFASLIKFDEIRLEYLPTDSLSKGSLKDQRKARFELAEKLWGKNRQFWLEQESAWLQAMRERTGSSQEDGKEDYQDVVSVLILTTIYTLTYIYYQFLQNKISQEVLLFCLKAANDDLLTPLLKGLARSTKVGEINLYNEVRDLGLRVGGSGKYLPDPEVNLPKLLSFFLPEHINQDIYK